MENWGWGVVALLAKNTKQIGEKNLNNTPIIGVLFRFFSYFFLGGSEMSSSIE